MAHRLAASIRDIAIFVLTACFLIGCNPPPTKAPTAQPTAKPEPTVGLRDWVCDPDVVPAERDSGPRRIVSLAPNVTEMCCALGLRDRLVGRTRYCDYPPGIEGVRNLGSLIDLSVETLVGLKPDLILTSGRSRQISERLERTGLHYESVPDDSLDDLFGALARIGRLTAHEQTAARLATGIRAELVEISARHRDVTPTRVLLVIGTLPAPPAPPGVAGDGSFYDQLLQLSGHDNAAPPGRPFGVLALEAVLKADPDVIIELDATGTSRPNGDDDARRAWSALGDLRAVRDGRVHVLTGQQHFILGPRIAHTYDALCNAIAEPEHD